MHIVQKALAIALALAVLAAYRSQSVYADPDRAADEAREHQVDVRTRTQPLMIEVTYNLNFAAPVAYASHSSNNGETISMPMTNAPHGLPTDLDLFFPGDDEAVCQRAMDMTRVQVDRSEHNVTLLWASPSIGIQGTQCRYRVVYQH